MNELAKLIEQSKVDPKTHKKSTGNGIEVIIPSEDTIDNIIAFLKENPTLFDTPHPKLVSFFLENFDEEIPWGASSWNYYGVNFLTYFAPLAFSRATWTRVCEEFFIAHKGMKKGGDAIQYINKSGQKGLQHQKVNLGRVPHYHLAFYEVSDYRRISYEAVDEEFYADGIDRGINFLTKMLNIYNRAKKTNKIDVGHRNPYGSDPSSSNLVAQPSEINRAYRDKFIFDENGMPAAPSPSYLVDNVDKYYNEEALDEIIYKLALAGKLKLKEATVQAVLKNMGNRTPPSPDSD